MTKCCTVPSSPIKTRKKNVGEEKFDAVGSVWENLREREHFSLEIRAIRPSAVFGTRRRTAIRGEGFAWVPDLGSFLKLREILVSTYLGFIPFLSPLRMFESIEAARGRWISPKPCNRINTIFGIKMVQP